MQLNIHIIIHPIIQQLANKIIYHKSYRNKTYNDNEKTLGMLILYETLRTWIKLYNFYIKKVSFLKEGNYTNKDEKCLIITDLIKHHNFFAESQKILPKIFLQHIYINKNNTRDNYIIHNIDSYDLSKYKIIIFDKFLNSYTIIQILNYLFRNTKINVDNMKIICLTCHHKILKEIGKKYPELNIYTTKIIQN
uniref:Uracil phosphoribosyltransferase n=1 Tax=Gracilariopsis heteroclada TaxID=172978 RepID=A0A344V6F6_9FLOR|nr:uracil phosphoribosyltransferase [Gracilariopsis heteroclada]AXE43543.1 uracil phosphoribosyltransferase [Gracilariopsis heteroclada]